MEIDTIRNLYLENKNQKIALFYLGQWALAVDASSKNLNTSPINPRLDRGLVKIIADDSTLLLENLKAIQHEVVKLGINIDYSKKINQLEQLAYEAKNLLPTGIKPADFMYD